MTAKATSSVLPAFEMTSFFKKLTSFAGAFGLVLIAACMPVGNQEVNNDLFKNQEEMKLAVSSLKAGMTEDAVFKQLNIPTEKFNHMSTTEMQLSIYGNSQVQGSPDQLEQFRQKLMNYEGYSLPYTNLESKGTFGFGTMKTNKSGYDLRMVLIFEHNRLMHASVDGRPMVNENSDQYIWGSVLKKTTGIGF